MSHAVKSTEPMSNGKSMKAVPRRIAMGAMSKVTPSTRPMFAIFEPSALPTASSPDPASTDMIEIRISGEDVPTETTVSPISMGVRPARWAMADAPSTKRSALQTRIAKPAAIAAT